QVQQVLATLFPGEVSLTREKAGISFTYTPWDQLEVFFRVGNEWRNGTRPFSATFGTVSEGGATEVVEPIHYRTLDISSRMRLKGEQLQANLTYVGSFFRNDTPSLVWDNPGLTNLPATAFIPTQGRLALPPDNNYHTVKGDLAYALSKKLRFTTSASYSIMEQ